MNCKIFKLWNGNWWIENCKIINCTIVNCIAKLQSCKLKYLELQIGLLQNSKLKSRKIKIDELNKMQNNALHNYELHCKIALSWIAKWGQFPTDQLKTRLEERRRSREGPEAVTSPVAGTKMMTSSGGSNPSSFVPESIAVDIQRAVQVANESSKLLYL